MIENSNVNFSENQPIEGYIKIGDYWYLVLNDTTAEKMSPMIGLSCELNYFIKITKSIVLTWLSERLDVVLQWFNQSAS